MSTAVVTLVTSRENREALVNQRIRAGHGRGVLTFCMPVEKDESFSYVTSDPQVVKWKTWGMGTGQRNWDASPPYSGAKKWRFFCSSRQVFT